MILLLDAGNTRLKWACLVGGAVQRGEALPRSGDAGADVRALALAWAPLPPPERILVASVLDREFIAALSSSTMEAWSVAVEAVTPRREAFGVTNGYEEPERLGVDRWLALLAARRRVEGAVCVVDCGTAITIDALRGDGAHLGGLILPGLGLMRRAMTAAAQGLGAADGIPDEETPLSHARSTRPALMAGTLCAAVAGIDRAVAGLRGPLGGEPVRLITGGDAERLLPLLAGSYTYRPDLVLEGLALIAEGGGG